MGVSFGVPRASLIPVTTKTPAVGAAILTYENSSGTRSGHVGVVTAVDETKKTVTFVEANYVSCTVTVRTLARNDSRIRGYWARF